jgi:alkylation response protein AidB-like acyl-CoA dehydrogenase
MNNKDLLQITENYLKEYVAPHANLMDEDAQILKKALVGMQARSLLSLFIPQEYHGLEIEPEIFSEFQELVARYSGALYFLQTQHQSATRLIVNSENHILKQEILSEIEEGKLLLGIGFSHLRRTGVPAVIAKPTKNGYRLSGEVPWVTGFGFFQAFIVAASSSNDEGTIFGIIPFLNYQENSGEISLGEIMPMVAMTSTNTVIVTLKDWFLPEENVIFRNGSEWISHNDLRSILNTIPGTLGCARAGLDVIQSVMNSKKLPFIMTTYTSLEAEFYQLKEQFKLVSKRTFEHQLKLRADVINFAARCSYAAVIVSSGASNSKMNAAGRIYREVLVYTVSGQNTAIMEATLNQLIDDL